MLGPLTPAKSLDDGEEESSDDEGFSPDLPPRNYNRDTLRSLFSKQRQSSSASSTSKSNILFASMVKAKRTKPKPLPRKSSYEEIDIDDEPEVASRESRSPSFLNSLIQNNKRKVAHTTSSSSSSSEEGMTDEGFYSVLSKDFTQLQRNGEMNYSIVG